jgi:hypothetical protein
LSPDLDLRPGEPTRSTLPQWVQTCRGCGAAAPDLAALAPEQRAIVDSAAYQALAASETALPFLRWACLCQDPVAQGEAWLQAAWTADDAGAAENARAWRRAAAEAWGEPADPERALRLLDVLRRAELFPQATALAERLSEMDEGSARIVAFQLARVAERDTGRHLMSSALRPPAHRPHVAHQAKPEKRGFWRLITGR